MLKTFICNNPVPRGDFTLICVIKCEKLEARYEPHWHEVQNANTAGMIKLRDERTCYGAQEMWGWL